MAGGKLKQALLSLMLFFTLFLSYRPFYGELVSIHNNATLTNALTGLTVAIFPIIWVMLCIVTLGLTVYLVAGEL